MSLDQCHEFASCALRIMHKGECKTSVTGDDEAHGTTGRRKRRGEARFRPSRLYLRATFYRERDRETSGHEAGHEVFRTVQTFVITKRCY